MSLSRDSRQERKLKAIRLAQMRLKQRLEMIDWLEDVLQPEIEALKSGKGVMGLPDGMTLNVRVVHGIPDRSDSDQTE